MKRVLVLFPSAWDRERLAPETYPDVEFVFHGDDLFKFPGTLKLLTFDALGFIDDVEKRFGRANLDGVMSTDEYIGAIIAAEVARRLGLQGGDPASIILAQHKYYSRVAQQRVAPDVTPAATLIPLGKVDEHALSIPFPFFVKPCKGTFSVFAAKVDDLSALRKHLDFNVFERLALGRVVKPFNDLLRALTDLEHDASAFCGEGLMSGDQVTVDGFAYDGDVEIMGVVDSVMFEGTNTFERFEYPSRLPVSVQERMHRATADIVRGLGIRHGQFNVELFYDRATDKLGIIEINPRLSYQFADLYEYVDGSNTYDVLLDLTLAKRPRFESRAGQFEFSASFVMRTFEGKKLKSVPNADQVAAFNRRYSESTIKIYGKAGDSMKNEMKALGSYRYAIINVAANSLLDLFAIQQDAIEKLPFEHV